MGNRFIYAEDVYRCTLCGEYYHYPIKKGMIQAAKKVSRAKAVARRLRGDVFWVNGCNWCPITASACSREEK